MVHGLGPRLGDLEFRAVRMELGGKDRWLAV